MKKISFEPTDKILSAVHSIDDPAYCAKRAREVLSDLSNDPGVMDKQVLMAARLMILYFTQR